MAAVIVAGALWVASPGAARAQTVLESTDQTGNGYIDTWAMDDDDDGWIDRILIDANENGQAEVVAVFSFGTATGAWIDANLDLVFDMMLQPSYANGVIVGRTLWRDADQNGRWENAYFDGQLDGYFEWVLVDVNLDGAGDTWAQNVAPAGYSATDEMARQVAAVTAFQILQGGGVPIFGPLAWPVGG
jgi:hypothetical protein